MENSDKFDVAKLQKIISLRMTNEDYEILLRLSRNKHSNISRTIRTIVQVVLDMVKENKSCDQ